MYFLINDNKKINIGWSAKCGCTFVKKIFYYLSDIHVDNNEKDFHKNTHGSFNKNKNYTNIIICRNPYRRLVSGFLEKFQKEYYYKIWKEKSNNCINFQNLVNFLGNWEIIDEHHFTQQLSEAWDDDARVDYVFDISNINYSILENLFNKELPAEVLKSFYVTHRNENVFNKLNTTSIEPKLYETPIEILKGQECSHNQFYNLDLKNKVYNFYQKDFEFFKKNNIFYDIEI